MLNGCTHRGRWCRSVEHRTPAACSSGYVDRPPALQSEPASSSWKAGLWQPPRKSATRADRTLVKQKSRRKHKINGKLLLFKAPTSRTTLTCILGGQIHHLLFLFPTHSCTQRTWGREISSVKPNITLISAAISTQFNVETIYREGKISARSKRQNPGAEVCTFIIRGALSGSF